MSTDNPHNNCLTIAVSKDDIKIEPLWIGKVANENIRPGYKLVVRGTTSKGVFLELETKYILFISFEKYRGPLNIYIQNINSIKKSSLKVDDYGCVLKNKMILIPEKLAIKTTGIPIWSARENEISPAQLSVFANSNRLWQLIPQKLSNANPLLTAVNQAISGNEISDPNESWIGLSENLIHLIAGFKRNDFRRLERAFHFLIGRGIGLTPSGDDFLLGFFYSLYRLEQLHKRPLRDIFSVADRLLDRTTLISSNLIISAMHGEVDERLLAAFNALLVNHDPHPEVIAGLIGWGSSSGVDAFSGMGLGYWLVSELAKG